MATRTVFHVQYRLLINTALVLTLTACANYRGIHSDKVVRRVDSFATTQTLRTERGEAVGEWPREQWWNTFGDAQLSALMDEALAQSPSLDAAAARVKAAQAYTGTARSALFPQIDGSGDISYQHFSENWIYPPPYGGSSLFNSTLRVNGSYELDFWGKNRAALRAALSQQAVAEAEQQSTRLMLTSNIAKSYVELDRLFAARDVLQQTLQQREKIFALTQQRVTAGIDSNAELRQAETQLPALRGQIAQVDEAIGAARNALAALLGAGPDRGLQIERPHLNIAHDVVVLPANLPVDLLGRRPDIVSARAQVEATRQQTEVAKAQFYPNVSLTGYIGYSSLGLDNLTRASSEEYGIGPAIRLPIFAGGRLRANLKNNYANYDHAVALYNATLTDALRDVADQLNAMKWLQTRQHEQRDAVNIARSALDLATQRYEAGLGNYLSVLSAETQVSAQEQIGVELEARAQDLQINLIRALGGGFDVQARAAVTLNNTTAPVAMAAH